MASPIYSWKFFAEHDLDGTGAAFGPLDGYVAVVTHVDAVLGALSIGNVQLVGSAGEVIWVAAAISIGEQYFSWRGRYVLFPGETAYVETTSAQDVCVNGYMLLGPPPS